MALSRIAIIGWGSLIWDLEILAPQVTGDWLMGAGPPLPLEFSRISDKRKRALAVCIDPANGRPCPTHVIVSQRTEVGEAVEDLAARERAPLGRIGYAGPKDTFSRLPEVAEGVANWLETAPFDGAVWTDLEPRFEEITGAPFTLPRAIAYLRSLEGESLAEAHRYITEAPETTQTPLRDALASEVWWQCFARETVKSPDI